jgi:hypothetical protein
LSVILKYGANLDKKSDTIEINEIFLMEEEVVKRDTQRIHAS